MQKKIPMRRCVGCREMKPKRELCRVVRSPDGAVTLDAGGRSPGRGAYLCRNSECLLRAIKSRALPRALDAEVPDAVLEALRTELEAL